MVSVVLQESSNNFTHLDQTIDTRPIASVIYSPMTPEESKTLPKRVGEMYVQISEGSPEHKLRMWISVAVTNNNFVWEEATGVTTPLPDTIVRTDKVNDFQPYEQTISGHQILSFVDGGDLNPGQSGLPAAYDGQFYIAVKTLGDNTKDVAIWVAHGNQWLPIIKENIDTSNLAKLDSTNVFTEPTQMLGPAEDGRLIGATRVKRGTVSPIADAAWLAKLEGEQTIFFNTGTNPVEISIWTAISTTGTNPANQWKMTWSSKGSGSIDTTNLAKLDQQNTFVPLQKIGVENNTAFIHTSRKGPYDPSDVASPDILPYSEGELYVREYTDGGAVEHQIWLATDEGDTDSWIKIYDSQSSIIQVEAKIVELEAYDTTLDNRILALDGDLDNIATTVGNIDSDVTALDTDLNIVKNNITNLDTRVGSNELKIAALETHHENNQETFTTHSETLADHETRLTSNNTSIGSLIGQTNNVDSRLTMVEQKVPTIESSIATLTSQGGSHNDRITAAQNDAIDAWNKAVTIESLATSNMNKLKTLEPNVQDLTTRLAEVERILSELNVYTFKLNS